jgi:hypothetical protein
MKPSERIAQIAHEKHSAFIPGDPNVTHCDEANPRAIIDYLDERHEGNSVAHRIDAKRLGSDHVRIDKLIPIDGDRTNLIALRADGKIERSTDGVTWTTYVPETSGQPNRS